MRTYPTVLKLLLGCWVLLSGFTLRAGTNWLSAETNGLWFPVGEEMLYCGYWGVLTVGEARIWTEWIEEDGRKLLVIKLVAQSSLVVSALYPVNDSVESVVDPVTFLPVRYTQHIREGKKRRDDTITFDHKAGKAVWKPAGAVGTNATKEIAIDATTRDVLCFMYFARSKGFDVGTTNTFRVIFDDKLYTLTVSGLEYENIYLSHYGDVRCLELEPKAKFGEVFVRKGSVNMWVSDDERRICTKAMAIVPVANVKLFLQSVKGPGKDFWTSGKKKRR